MNPSFQKWYTYATLLHYLALMGKISNVKHISHKQADAFKKRCEGKSFRQIAKEQKASISGVKHRVDKVQAVLGLDQIEIYREQLFQKIAEPFLESVYKGVVEGNPMIINGAGKGLGIYRESLDVDNKSGRMSDAELIAALRTIFKLDPA